MEAVIPASILAWFASVPEQTWVWLRFIALIWLGMGSLVGIIRVIIVLNDDSHVYSQPVKRYLNSPLLGERLISYGNLFTEFLFWLIVWPFVVIFWLLIIISK